MNSLLNSFKSAAAWLLLLGFVAPKGNTATRRYCARDWLLASAAGTFFITPDSIHCCRVQVHCPETGGSRVAAAFELASAPGFSAAFSLANSSIASASPWRARVSRSASRNPFQAPGERCFPLGRCARLRCLVGFRGAGRGHRHAAERTNRRYARHILGSGAASGKTEARGQHYYQRAQREWMRKCASCYSSSTHLSAPGFIGNMSRACYSGISSPVNSYRLRLPFVRWCRS